MTGEEMQRKFAELVEDQSRRADPQRGTEWWRLSVAQQVAWEDLAAWVTRRIAEEGV